MSLLKKIQNNKLLKNCLIVLFAFLFLCGLIQSCANDRITSKQSERSTQLSQKYTFYDNSVKKLENNLSLNRKEANDAFETLVLCGLDEEITYITKPTDNSSPAKINSKKYDFRVYMKDKVIDAVYISDVALYENNHLVKTADNAVQQETQKATEKATKQQSTQELTTQQTTTQEITTQQPTTEELTTEEPTTEEATTEELVTEEKTTQETMVWVTDKGGSYHSRSTCSGMKSPYQITLSDAQARNLSPCKKCYK